MNSATDNNASASLIIREALSVDVPALAALHAQIFYETQGKYPGAPAYELREQQWRQAFEGSDKNWFCFVIENENHELTGFAKGVSYNTMIFPIFPVG
jgi:hypothetical protein